MSEPTPFIELRVAYRVMTVEEVRERLHKMGEELGHPLPEDLPLSLEGRAWLRRMRSAYVDTEVSTHAVREMDGAMCEALPETEAKELRRRLREFVLLRDCIPLTATSTQEAWPIVLLHPKRSHFLVRELKVGRNRLTREQQVWLDDLRAADVDAGVWRPEDWPRIERVLK